MTAVQPVHPYILYLADVACQRPVATPAPAVHLPDGSDPGLLQRDQLTLQPAGVDPAAFIMNVLRYVGTTPLPITRHGTDDMIDLLFQNPLFWSTLPHAAHIQEHFATTFLRTTNAVFQDHWTYVIVPAWNQMAHAYQIAQASVQNTPAAGAGSAAAGAT